jgi:allophanate hydrolase subunit 2
MGLALGAMQVPPDGRPIVMLADRPVTGGYAVPLCVIRADVGRVAQLLPGDAVRLTRVTREVARAANADAERELDRLEPPPEDGEDAIGWTGAHG